MATEFGFCPNCGTARSATGQKFCASCGAGLSAVAAPALVPAPPAAPQAEAAPPPPPAWGVPPALDAPVVTPAFSVAAPVAATRVKSGISPTMLLIGVVLIAAIAGGAYLVTNNNSKSSGPGGSNGASVSMAPSGPGGSNGGATGLSGAASAFSTINSYKFSMTLAGGTFGSMLSALGGSSASGNAPFAMSGTITVTPEKAADITMAGFHIIEIGGYDYLDMSGTGSFIKSAATGTSMADSFAPAKMFSSFVGTSTTSGYNKVGSETKNGVDTDHYQASSSALSELGSMLDVTGATWSADIWIAKDGGYPVSMAIIGKASDNSVACEILFDIANVNDPANKVTAPTNVTGA